ncbi:hypothetical protein [Alloscardovia macacae]|uniref:hypothetical protein n=1 Tax=Alloscardovia macacae TaxID=1160091 RepID=UPI0011D0A27A|nr:hypothetical protein [Alloscardovia macacae]
MNAREEFRESPVWSKEDGHLPGVVPVRASLFHRITRLVTTWMPLRIKTGIDLRGAIRKLDCHARVSGRTQPKSRSARMDVIHVSSKCIFARAAKSMPIHSSNVEFCSMLLSFLVEMRRGLFSRSTAATIQVTVKIRDARGYTL